MAMAEEPPCNSTQDDLKSDCYESMHAYKKIRTSSGGLRKSPNKWTKEENQKLTALVAHYGEKKWKRISAEMGSQKTGAQCAQHWKRVLSPEIRKGHWDETEEDLLLRLVVQYGSCWKKIAKKIPQRTDIQCRYQYLKAKQSREVKWDAKEDESLIKRVMEMASGNFVKLTNGDSSCSPSNSNHADSLTTDATPPRSPSPSVDKENETDNRRTRLRRSINGDVSDRASLTSSDESSGDCSWNDSRNNVTMSDSSDPRAPSCGNEKDSAGWPRGLALNHVVWLEVAEHMARMKLTTTLRTALECKTRFMELLGSALFSDGATGHEGETPRFGLKSTNDATAPPSSFDSSRTPLARLGAADTNINISISNGNGNNHNNNNITITNFSRNITINITNNNTTSTTNHTTNHTSTHFPFFPIPSHAGILPPKPERTSPTTEPPPAPSFPSFPSHITPVAQPLPPPTKPAPARFAAPRPAARSNMVPSGLESLAAVASILPREMLAEHYASYDMPPS